MESDFNFVNLDETLPEVFASSVSSRVTHCKTVSLSLPRWQKQVDFSRGLRLQLQFASTIILRDLFVSHVSRRVGDNCLRFRVLSPELLDNCSNSAPR